MTIYEQIEHATDTEARIRDFINELDNQPGETVDKYLLVNKLNGIFARAADARFENNCRQADFSNNS
jgi:hypothetical protein